MSTGSREPRFRTSAAGREEVDLPVRDMPALRLNDVPRIRGRLFAGREYRKTLEEPGRNDEGCREPVLSPLTSRG